MGSSRWQTNPSCLRGILDPFDFAAIHPDRSACEPTSLFGNQVCHESGNLVRFTVAGDASLFRKLLHGLFRAHSVLRRPPSEERSAAASHDWTRHYAVDLDSILNALLGEGLRERNDGSVDGRYGREARLRIESPASGDEYDRAVRSLQSVPGPYRQPPRTVQLKYHAVFPLRVRHLEQVNLRHRPGNI